MNPICRVLIAVTVLLVVTGGADGIKCWDCSSETSASCLKDPKPLGTTVVEKECGGNLVCLKILETKGEKKTVTRKCFRTEKEDPVDECIKSDRNGTAIEDCICTTELCNGGGRMEIRYPFQLILLGKLAWMGLDAVAVF